MSKFDDGGPAFPRPANPLPHCDSEYSSEGMSLRDWMAGMAMSGWLASYGFESCHPAAVKDDGKAISDLARCCYLTADAMLAARKAVGH